MSGRHLRPLVLSLVVFGLFCAAFSPIILDNAYVTFRYMEELAQGNGIRFNAEGPETEGFASWLWLLAGAVVSRLGASVTGAMVWLSALFGAITIVVLWRHLVAGERSEFEVGMPLVFLAASGPFALYAVSGMESTLFSLLLLLTLLLSGWVSSRPLTTGVVVLGLCGTFLALCRPEGIIVLPVIAVVQRITGRPARRTMISALIVVIIVGVFSVWRSTHFGSLLPPPFWNGVAAPLGQRIAQNLLAYFVAQGYDFPAFGYYYIGVAIVALIGWNAAGRARAGTETAALGVCATLAIVYLFFVDLMPGMRYHASLIPLLMLPGVHAAGALGRFIEKLFPDRSRAARAVVFVSALIICAGWMADLRLASRRLHRANETTLVELGEWLGEHMPSGSLLSTDTPGIMPYYSRLETAAIQPYPITGKGREKFSLDRFLARPPDAVVVQSRGVFGEDMDPLQRELTSSPRFESHYRLLAAIRFDWFHDRSYWIYIPRGMRFEREQLEKLPQGIGSVRRINF